MSSKKASIVASHPVRAKSSGQPKIRPQKERKSPPNQLQAQAASGPATKGVTTVNAVVNPYLLTQFLFGYISRGLSDADAIYDSSMVSSLVYTTLKLLSDGDILNLGIRSLPREIVDLYWSLRVTTYKGVLFFCNNTSLNTFIAQMNGVGWSDGVGLLDVTYPIATTGTDGFYTCARTPSLLSGTQLRDAWAQYGSAFTMVDVMDRSRASVDVFSFDIQAPFSGSNVGIAVIPLALAGFSSPAAQVYIRQDSNCGLEVVPQKHSWMGHLRLCTQISYVKGTIVTAADTTRLPKHSWQVNAFPSVIGHQMGSGKGEYKGIVQLKTVPFVSGLNDIIARLENAITACGQLTLWKSTFTPSEVKLVAYGLWRAANARYAASAYGIFVTSGSSGLTAETMFDSAGFKLFQSLKVPEVLNDCLQAQKVFSDRNGVLLPLYTRYGQLNNLTTATGYTGTGIGVLPDDTGTTSARYFSKAIDVILKYKPFETALSGISKMTPITSFGASYLDVTLSRDQASFGVGAGGNVNLISARRPLITPLVFGALMKINYISYDYAPPAGITFVAATGPEDRTKSYKQDFCLPLSGVDTVVKIGQAAIFDGLVPLGAQADNTVPYSDSAFDAPAPLAPPVSPGYRSIGYRLMSEVPGLSSITYGNYGGPGWTAGSRDPTKWHMKNGKYLTPAVDEEDALYKRHDEAVALAAGDVLKEAQADEDLYHHLVVYSKGADLSIFGKGARTYFSPRVPRDKSEL